MDNEPAPAPTPPNQTPTPTEPPVPPQTSPAAPAVAAPAVAANPTAAPVAPAVPQTWPGAFGLYKYSKAIVMYNLVTLLLFIAATFVISILLGAILKPRGLAQLISFVINVIFSAAITVILLASLNHEKVELKQVFDRSLKYAIQVLGASVLVFLAIMASILLFIVPVFFVAPRLVLVNYFIVDQNMSFTDAFKASWDATKGHVGKVYGIIGASIVMALPVFTIIGIPVAVYFLFMFSAATVVLYKFITNNQKITA
jgi:hypothetical protein